MTDAEVSALIRQHGPTGAAMRIRLAEIRTASGDALERHLDAFRWRTAAQKLPQAAAVAELVRGGDDVRGRVLALFQEGVE